MHDTAQEQRQGSPGEGQQLFCKLVPGAFPAAQQQTGPMKGTVQKPVEIMSYLLPPSLSA